MHNFVKIILADQESGRFKPGIMTIGMVMHDDWCGYYLGARV